MERAGPPPSVTHSVQPDVAEMQGAACKAGVQETIIDSMIETGIETGGRIHLSMASLLMSRGYTMIMGVFRECATAGFGTCRALAQSIRARMSLKESKMIRRAVAVAVSGCFGAFMLCAADTKPVKVDMKDAKGASIGSATISAKKSGQGVDIKLDLKGLPPGEHALHIHGTA